MSRAPGWVVEGGGRRYGVLAPSARAALALARDVGCVGEPLATRGPLPPAHARALRAQRGTVLLELRALAERARERGVALPRYRAQISFRRTSTDQPKEVTMAKTKTKGKGYEGKGKKRANGEQAYRVNGSSDYAVREGTLSHKFVAALPSGKFTKAAAVSATTKAVKNEARASLFFNYFKGKGVIATA